MDLKKLKSEFLKELETVSNTKTLLELDVKYFGRKQGILTEALKGIKDLPENERKTFGNDLNVLKNELFEKFEEKKRSFEDTIETNDFDETLELPKTKWNGSKHPFNIVLSEIIDIFTRMGYCVVDSPELDSSYHSFDALNFAKDHPARDTMDTFYVGGGDEYLLRPHTSSMQNRLLKKFKGEYPIRAIIPGKVFRNEKIDSTHDVVFHQVEGVFVDKGITMSHLIWTLKTILYELFGKEMKIRIRPNFFPFVEPGIELDIWYPPKNKWMEMLGAGMIHRNVLKEAGIDPDIYSGFAFGMGPGRMTMIKYGLSDLRNLMSNDVRFLSQFR